MFCFLSFPRGFMSPQDLGLKTCRVIYAKFFGETRKPLKLKLKSEKVGAVIAQKHRFL